MQVCSATLRLVVLTIATLVAGAAIAQAPAGKAAAPRPATPTTFEAVHNGKHAAGASVQFQVILLPETAIQNTSGGKTTYYVLAVHKGGSPAMA